MVISLSTLCDVLHSLRRRVALGPSGLSNDHIIQLFPTATESDKALLEPLLAFVNKVVAGNVDDKTADWLGPPSVKASGAHHKGRGWGRKTACGFVARSETYSHP